MTVTTGDGWVMALFDSVGSHPRVQSLLCNEDATLVLHPAYQNRTSQCFQGAGTHTHSILLTLSSLLRIRIKRLIQVLWLVDKVL
jgi:hypothetical protein